MRRLLCIYFLLPGALMCAYAAGDVQQKQLLRVQVQNRQQAEQLAQMPLDFASRAIGTYTDIVADAAEENLLRGMGFEIEVLESSATLAKKLSRLDETMGAYHTYAELTAELQDIAAAFPHITALHSLGKSWENRDIWAMLISDNPQIEEPEEPGVLYIGAIHAREIITPEIVLHFLQYLVHNYGVDPQVTRLVQTRRLWLAPMMNPDGHVQVESGNRWWRKNRRLLPDGNYGVDLNRNFGFKWGYDNLGSSSNTWSETYRGPAPFSEPEARAIQNLVTTRSFAACLCYHSYGRLWLFPWDYAKMNTPHHEVFLEMAGAMTAANGYTVGNSAMGTIYLVNGGTDDYFYGEQNDKNIIFGFTPEVGATFFPPESDIPRHLAETLPANLYIAEAAELLSQDPWRMLRPSPSPLYAAPADDDGCFRLFWQSRTPPPNTPIAFELQELTGYRIGEDDAVGQTAAWNFEGFAPTDQYGCDDRYCYYARAGSAFRATLTTTLPIVPQQGQMLTFKLSCHLTAGRDYLYVRISQNQGRNYVHINGNITTYENPHGHNLGHGITGSSNGWVDGRFDLSAFAGKPILVQFLFVADGNSDGGIVYIDDIAPVALVDAVHTLTIAPADTGFFMQKRIPEDYVFRLRGIDGDEHYSDWCDPVIIPVDFGQVADIDRDGRIDQADVGRCCDIILGLGAEPSAGELYRANVDGSAESGRDAVNVIDLVQLIKKSANSGDAKIVSAGQNP